MPLMANAEAGENEAPIGMVCSGGTSVIKDLGRYVLDGARSGRVTSLSFLFLELWRIRKPYSKSSLRNEVRPGAQYWFMWRSKSIH